MTLILKSLFRDFRNDTKGFLASYAQTKYDTTSHRAARKGEFKHPPVKITTDLVQQISIPTMEI